MSGNVIPAAEVHENSVIASGTFGSPPARSAARVFEVFPSASYTMLAEDTSIRLNLSLSGFARGPKDMLDAHVAAVTVREFAQGRGCAVGGGDGLGSIILPRPLKGEIAGVLTWPETPTNSE